MNTTSFMDLVQNFETSKVVAYLHALNLQELSHSPYFLGTVGTLVVISLIMRWHALLVTVVCLGGFAWLLSYTLARDTTLQGGGGNDTLLVFVAGGGLLVFLAIYLLFIRGD